MKKNREMGFYVAKAKANGRSLVRARAQEGNNHTGIAAKRKRTSNAERERASHCVTLS